MRAFRSGLLASLALLAACQAQGTLTHVQPTKTQTQVSASGAPTTPGASTDHAAANNGPVAGGLLQKPAGGGATVSGTLSIDAAYAIASAAGVISNDGSTLIGKVKASDLISDHGGGLIGKVKGADLVANNGGGIISDTGGGLIGKVKANGVISDHGAGVISDHGAGVISEAGGSVVSTAGSNLIVGDGSSLVSDAGLGLIGDSAAGLIGKVKLLANNGSSLVANNGGNLIANNGGGLVSNNGGALIGKTKYRLEAGASGPASGTSLPAASMLVGAVSLVDGHAVPIGVDAMGQPAFAVYTDKAGNFTVFLPPGLVGNVRLVAKPAAGEDLRLDYGLVVPADGGKDLVIDETTAQASAFLRVVMIARIADLISKDTGDPVKTAGAIGKIPAFLQGQATAIVLALQKIALDNNMAAMTDGQRRAVILGAADALCAYADLSKMTADAKLTGSTDTPPLAIPTLARVLKEVLEKSKALLARDPKFFESRPYLVAVNRQRVAAGLPQFHVIKPADVGALIVTEFLSSNVPAQTAKADLVLTDLGLPLSESVAVRAATVGVYESLGAVMISNPDAQTACKNALNAFGVAIKSTPIPPAPTPIPGDVPPAPAATPETSVVSTIAGSSDFRSLDGTIATGSFDSPAGVVLDATATGAGQTFYISDDSALLIRKVVVDAAGNGTVTTVAGQRRPGTTDGPGASALFAHPNGLALGKDHQLYVADRDNNTIRAIDLNSPGFKVTTVAGTGSAGYADAPGGSAQFNAPQALAIDANGDLAIGEQGSNRLRLMKTADPAHTVSTIAGTGAPSSLDGPISEATLGPVYGLGLAPDGALVFSDGIFGQIRKLTPDKRIVTIAGGVKGGLADGFWEDAGFYGPNGICIDPKGNIFVADRDNHRIREIAPTGDVTTLAGGGAGGNLGAVAVGSFVDGPGLQARFNLPMGLAMDAQGNLYVGDTFNHRLRKVTRQP